MSGPGRTQFDLIVFDLDGVLVDSSPAHARAFADLWAQLGIAGPSYDELAGLRTDAAVLRVMGGEWAGTAELAEWSSFKRERARGYLAQGNVAFADAQPALARLAEAGFGLAVGTAASRATATAVLERAGLRHQLGQVVTGDDVAHGKPSPDVFVAAIRWSGGTPARSLVVEDSIPGLVAGHAAGAATVSVRTGVVIESPRFIGAHPDLSRLSAWLLGE